MNKENVGLYDQSFEHDNCGIGAVVNIKGLKTYKTVDDALKIVEQLEHRAGKDAAGETGDGVGILTQIPDEYFQKIIKDFTLPQKGHYGVGIAHLVICVKISTFFMIFLKNSYIVYIF